MSDDKRAEKIVLTYKDNEYLSKEEKEEIESYKTRAFYDHKLKNYDFKENIKNYYWRNKW